MAQPNVAREPSMDEILASIRKIIESNEPGIPGFPANDLGPASNNAYRGYDDDDTGEDIHLTIDDEVLAKEFEAEEQKNFMPAERVAQAHDREEPVPEPQRQEPQSVSVEDAKPAATPPPMSLADVAARVRAASERHSAPLRDAENQARAKTDNPMVTSRMAPMSSPLYTGNKQDAAPAVSVASPVSGPEPRIETAEPAAAAVEEAAAQRQPLSIVSEKDVAALVSPAVSEQVARSFGDLALAVDSSSRRSFDEIAEDMLRPMLHEWLDDNLPTLVERLVREEIERVARGPRR